MIRVMIGLSLVVTGWGISLAMLTTFPLNAVLHYLYIYNIVRICDTLQIYILFCRKSRNEMDPKEACTKSNCVFEIKIDLTLVGNGTRALILK